MLWVLQEARASTKLRLAVTTLEDRLMQGQDSEDTKVVSILSQHKKDETLAKNRPAEQDTQDSKDIAKDLKESKDFLEVMRQNQKNKERIERERANANKSVLRTYRIKH